MRVHLPLRRLRASPVQPPPEAVAHATLDAHRRDADLVRWRQVASCLPQLVWSCTADGYCDFLGPQWLEYTGMPEEQQLGQGWLEQVHPQDRELVMVSWMESVRSGQPLRVEFRLRRHDGQYHWFDTRAQPVRDDAGRIVRWVGSNTDVQDRVAMSQALQASERRFKTTYCSAPVSIWQQDWSLILDAIGVLRAQGVTDMDGYFATRPAELDRLLAGLVVLDVNPWTLARLQAATLQELLAALPQVLGTAAFRREFVRILQALADGQAEQRGELMLRTVVGEPVPVLYSIALPAPRGVGSEAGATGQAGAEAGFLTFCAADISDRHRADAEVQRLNAELEGRVAEQAAALRQRKRELRSILDHMPSLIGYWDKHLRNRFCNLAYGDWFGKDPDKLAGMHIRELLGEERYQLNLPYIEGVLAGREQFFEREFVRPDGKGSRHSQAQYLPDWAEDGTVQGFFVLVTDVSAIKEAQQRASDLLSFNQAVIDTSPAGIAVYQPNGTCVLANTALAAALGGSVQRLRQFNFRELATWRDSGLLALADATLADGQTRRLDAHLTSSFGRDVWLDCAFAAVDRNGQRHLLAVVHDITDQHRAQAALALARDQAEAAARAKAAFLANMSHEIRTPMNAILGLSRLALESEMAPRSRDYLDKVYTAALGLMGILDDVLDYSKIEAGQLQFESIEFDLEDLLRRVADLFALRIEQKGLELLFDVQPDVPRRVIGDPLRLSQVIDNLVGNAVKFTPTGLIVVSMARLAEPAVASADVGVGVEAAPPANCHLRFSVRDTGIGIAGEQVAHLFDAFTQADSSITRRFGGTGLGLAICKRLVHGMGGQIGVYSEPGRGSEFHFRVSLGLVPDAADAAPAAQSDGLAAWAGIRALVLDEGEVSSELTAQRLRAWHLHAKAVSNWCAALDELDDADAAGRPYGLIVLDAKGSGTDALQALRRLRCWWTQGGAPDEAEGGHATGLPRVPIVVLAAAAARDSLANLSQPEAPDALLTKPVLPSHLLGALRAVRQATSPQAPEARDPAADLLARARPLQGLRVLLAEDNAVNQLVATELLGSMGVEVVVVPDGIDAVEAISRAEPGRFDAVLMDLHMPIMGGEEAARRILQMPQAAGLPIMAMSAAAMDEDRQRSKQAGMVDHVSKPVMPERLLDALLQWAVPARQARLMKTVAAN